MSFSKNEIALVIFSKTPGVSPVKTRLAQGVGLEKAEEFFTKSLEVTIKLVQSIKRVDLIMALAEEDFPSHPLWKNLNCIYQGAGGLAEKLSLVYSKLQKQYRTIIFMGGDSPHIPQKSIEEAIEYSTSNFVLGETADGGFYLFAGSAEIEQRVWSKVSYSSEKTFQQLKKELMSIGNVHELEKSFDLDVLEDINHFKDLDRSELLEIQCEFVDWTFNKFLINK